jgi:hypothetical protein
MSDEQITVVLAHGTVAGRLALRMLVEIEDGFEVVGEADHVGRAGQLARELRPSFLVVHAAVLADARPGPLPLSCRLVFLGLEPHTGAEGLGVHDYVQWDRAGEDLPAILHRSRGQLGLVPEP